MRRLLHALLFCGVLVALGWMPLEASAQSGGLVREIIVEGQQRIEPGTIRSYLLIQEGDPFSPSRIDRSLKSLFATGLFADVSMNRKGDDLIVNVVENPVINRIAFEGNQRIENEVLESEVVLRPRIIFTRAKVQNDVKRILTLYRRSGRFAATVEPKVIELPQNRVDLVFEISEGKLTSVRNIRFVGNKQFDDSRLRDIIRTKETRWYRFLSGDDTYDPDRLTFDRELLRRFYLSKGYADLKVVSAVAELTPNREDFFITFTVEEGARYRFGEIGIEANLRGLDSESVRQTLEIEEGKWFDSSKLDKTIDDLTETVGTLGYAFVEIRPRIDRNRETRRINVVFEIGEGQRVFVERIDITGNVRTVDDVIRREFRLVEGDAYNSAKLRRSRSRIQNLDFFEKVEVERIPGSTPDKTVIKVDVVEKSTGSFKFGAGFSTTNGVLADFEIRERNLLGRGRDLKLNLLLAALRSQIDLAYTEPYFLDRDINAGFNVFRTSTDLQDSSSFDKDSTGGSLHMGYPITENLSQSWRYSASVTEVSNVDSSASSFIRAAEGERSLSQISHTLTYDKRDSRVEPGEGYILRMTNDIAGLGGSSKYVRYRLDGAKYYTVTDDWVVTLSAGGGQIIGLGQDVNLLDRFFTGGDDLRGFANAGIGPRDNASDDALGGEWTYVASAELTFPLGMPTELPVKGKVFTDLGSTGKIEPSSAAVNDTASLRMTVGAGLIWASPFGPIGIDVGFPVLKEDFDVVETIRVNFGARF